MEKQKDLNGELEKAFLKLPAEERETVISHGVALRLSELRKRLFLAENKVKYFEKKYKKTLSEIESLGLPDDADHETHEDYVMWRHWAKAVDRAKKDITALEKIAEGRLYLGSEYEGH